MSFARAVPLLFLAFGSAALAQGPPAPQDVTISAADGTTLKATYYAAAKPGPAVLLLHMCNTTRTSWEPLGRQLAAAGIHALVRRLPRVRRERRRSLRPARTQDAQNIVNDKWPGDIDTAYDFLLAQPGVDRTRVGVAGGSCGVTQAVRLARRHPDVRSLVLLAGPLDRRRAGLPHRTPWLPIFAAAAADDQYDDDAPELMQWILAMSGNPRNTFSGFKDGKHGTEIFGPHPELPTQIVALVDGHAGEGSGRSEGAGDAEEHADARVLAEGDVAGRSRPRPSQLFHETRERDPHAFLFPEGAAEPARLQHLQAGSTRTPSQLFTLNTEAYPTSANTHDSLGDAYLADGQNELALRASEKAIALLATDDVDDDRKKAIRESAEQKIATIKGQKKK